MSFQPVVPISGYAGWKFLERTLDTQRDAFTESRPVQSATESFRARIGSVKTAEDLVGDRDLLRVALGAFGLDDDLNNRFFIRKILEGGTRDRDALANRLSDSRYARLTGAFGFGDIGPPRTQAPGFADQIIDRYETRQFERAVGESDNAMRLALNLAPALRDIVSDTRSGDAQWFALMGNPPLRQVFETALGLPPSFGSLDIDQQLGQFKARSTQVLGTDRVAEFLSQDSQDKLIRLFLVRNEAQSTSSLGGASVALSLLQQSQGTGLF